MRPAELYSEILVSRTAQILLGAVLESQIRITVGKYKCRQACRSVLGRWSVKGKGAGLGVGVFVSTLELWFLWLGNRAIELTVTSPFLTLYIMQALSDVLLDCKFSSSRWAMRAATDAA